MSAIVCEPAEGTEINISSQWPLELVGDEFIPLHYDSAISWHLAFFRDQFNEKVQVCRFDSGLIVADICED